MGEAAIRCDIAKITKREALSKNEKSRASLGEASADALGTAPFMGDEKKPYGLEGFRTPFTI